MTEETIQNIRLAIEKSASEDAGVNCRAEHLITVTVMEGWRDNIIWNAEVATFLLKGHPIAKRAYGWQTGEGTDAKFTAVLEIPPVDSANTAVRVAIAAKARR